MDKKILLVLFLLLSTALVAAYLRGNFSSARSLPGVRVSVGAAEYAVEVVESVPAKAQGLSGREGLDAGTGMLFVFRPASTQAFWMHGMKFPIDIVWIANEKVIGVVANAPVPQGLSVPTFTSPAPVDYVLEIPAGEAAKAGITEGSPVTITGYAN